MTIDVRLPDGRIVRNVPDGMTKEELMERVGAAAAPEPTAAPAAPEPTAPSTTAVPEAPARGPMTAGEVLGGAAKNFGPDAVRYGKDIVDGVVQTVAHPIDTAKAIGSLVGGVVGGVVQKARNYGPPQTRGSLEPFDETAADAVGKDFMDTYGSWEATKRRIAERPVAFIGDLSTALVGGPGVIGKTGKLIDPVRVVGKIADKTGDLINTTARLEAGTATGTGLNALKEAGEAGEEGGKRATAFLNNLRGHADIEDVVPMAERALTKMIKDKADLYRSQKQGWAGKSDILDLSAVERELIKTAQIDTFKGIDLKPSTKQAWEDVWGVVNKWKGLDPAEYHTAEGLDALKKQLWDIENKIPLENKSARKVVADVRNKVRDQIVAQDPLYGKAMMDYAKAENQLTQIQRTLSLGKHNRSTDTALRKLQSVMRNNVNATYGGREKLARALEDAGATELFPSLAGQALSNPLPRGLSSSLTPLTGLALMGTSPWTLPALATASPYLMGEAAYYAGKARGVKNRGMNAARTVTDRIPGDPVALTEAARFNQAAKEKDNAPDLFARGGHAQRSDALQARLDRLQRMAKRRGAV